MPRGNPGQAISIRFNPDVIAKARLLLQDPIRGRTRYGGLSDLVNHLLLQWTSDQVRIQEAANKKASPNE